MPPRSSPPHLEMPKGGSGGFLNSHAAKLQGDHTGVVICGLRFVPASPGRWWTVLIYINKCWQPTGGHSLGAGSPHSGPGWLENEGNSWAQPVMTPWTPIQACRMQVTPLWLPQDAAALDSGASDKVPCLETCSVSLVMLVR